MGSIPIRTILARSSNWLGHHPFTVKTYGFDPHPGYHLIDKNQSMMTTVLRDSILACRWADSSDWLERRAHNSRVVGSNPTRPTRRSPISSASQENA